MACIWYNTYIKEFSRRMVMRAKWVGVAEMLVLLLVIGQAGASENKDFYSDGDIMTGEQWNVVNIYDTPPLSPL
jgi:hypothetical protein